MNAADAARVLFGDAAASAPHQNRRAFVSFWRLLLALCLRRRASTRGENEDKRHQHNAAWQSVARRYSSAKRAFIFACGKRARSASCAGVARRWPQTVTAWRTTIIARCAARRHLRRAWRISVGARARAKNGQRRRRTSANGGARKIAYRLMALAACIAGIGNDMAASARDASKTRINIRKQQQRRRSKWHQKRRRATSRSRRRLRRRVRRHRRGIRRRWRHKIMGGGNGGVARCACAAGAMARHPRGGGPAYERR